MTFKEWLVRRQYPEMVGTGAVYDGTKSPDFNWWGAPESAVKPKKKKHKKDEGFDDSFSRAQYAYDNQTPDDDYDEITCPHCEEGMVACPECGEDGEPHPDCETCKGTGRTECPECEGSGEIAVHRSQNPRRMSRRDDPDYDPRDDDY